jgi:hypothetical protein
VLAVLWLAVLWLAVLWLALLWLALLWLALLLLKLAGVPEADNMLEDWSCPDAGSRSQRSCSRPSVWCRSFLVAAGRAPCPRR